MFTGLPVRPALQKIDDHRSEERATYTLAEATWPPSSEPPTVMSTRKT